jgi:hypothetical protein
LSVGCCTKRAAAVAITGLCLIERLAIMDPPPCLDRPGVVSRKK